MEKIAVVVLAAGLGTRMKSSKAKVLHEMCGEPMINVVLDQLHSVETKGEFLLSEVHVVVGYQKIEVVEVVEKWKGREKPQWSMNFVEQERQLGTGHAVQLAIEKISADIQTVVVLNGDLPLFTSEALATLRRSHAEKNCVATLGSAEFKDPGTYGRIVRKQKKFIKCVEFKDATPAQRKLKECNGGVYCFNLPWLKTALTQLNQKNKATEFYLPDVFEIATRTRKPIDAHKYADEGVLTGVNTLSELADAQCSLYRRTAQRWLGLGVHVVDPRHTFIGPRVRIGTGVTIGAFCEIGGKTQIGSGAKIGSHCSLKNVSVGEDAVLRSFTVAEDTEIGSESSVGPFVHLRPGTHLGHGVRVGNFVEFKAASLGDHSNAAHLSYIGDAEIGSGVNLGCGFITCNFDGQTRDGKRKHKTKVGDRVFVGSDTQLIAPIEIAEGTYIASGSTVTESVRDPDSLVIARSRQVTKSGYAKKYKK